MHCGSPVQRNGVLGKGALRLQLAMLRATTRQVQLRAMVERAQEDLMAMNDRQYKQVSMEYMKKRHGLVSAVSASWVPPFPGNVWKGLLCLSACVFSSTATTILLLSSACCTAKP